MKSETVRRTVLGIILSGALPLAGESTGFLEIQAIGGLDGGKVVGHSLHAMDTMQKTSLGLDTLFRFVGEEGDWGVLALQGRLAWDPHGEHPLEPQLYTAAFRLKRVADGDLWFGHAKPAYGISLVLDNHALLLPDPAMFGFGYDRDWGVGWIRQTEGGDVSLSLTTGSGMPFRFKGNWFAAARISFGVLEQDNASFGISAGGGKTLAVMGYHVLDETPRMLLETSFDFRAVVDAWEFFVQGSIGIHADAFSGLLWARVAYLLDDAGVWRIELQPQLARRTGKTMQALYGGLSVAATADLAMRLMGQFGGEGPEMVLQVYWNTRLW